MIQGLTANGSVTELQPTATGAGIASMATPLRRISVACNLTEPMRWKQIVAMLGTRVEPHGVVVDVHVSRAGSVLSDGPKPHGELPIGHPVHLVFQEAQEAQGVQ